MYQYIHVPVVNIAKILYECLLEIVGTNPRTSTDCHKICQVKDATPASDQFSWKLAGTSIKLFSN